VLTKSAVKLGDVVAKMGTCDSNVKVTLAWICKMPGSTAGPVPHRPGRLTHALDCSTLQVAGCNVHTCLALGVHASGWSRQKLLASACRRYRLNPTRIRHEVRFKLVFAVSAIPIDALLAHSLYTIFQHTDTAANTNLRIPIHASHQFRSGWRMLFHEPDSTRRQ
jgi:hypothetical protein